MTIATDVGLFTTVQSALSEQRFASEEDRRTGERRRYECTQLLAPYDARTLPQQADFRQVQCHDLSPTGFSFYSYRKPETENVVIALGAIPFKFFVAEIIHMSRSEEGDGRNFLIGCHFLQRLTG